MPKVSFYLAKSDPSEYSLADLERDQDALWDGVTNAAALIALRAMKAGDCVLIYHSQGQSSIVGWAYVSGDPVPNSDNPKLVAVPLRFGGSLATPLSLAEVKQSGLFEDFALVRQGRLSTMPVPPAFISWLKKQRRDFKP